MSIKNNNNNNNNNNDNNNIGGKNLLQVFKNNDTKTITISLI